MLFDLAPSILAAKLAAESIYHRVLAATASYAEWRHDNPQIAHLIDEGVDLATVTLTAHGVPVATIEQIGAVLPRLITASLSGIAAADATVQSGISVAGAPAPVLTATSAAVTPLAPPPAPIPVPILPPNVVVQPIAPNQGSSLFTPSIDNQGAQQ